MRAALLSLVLLAACTNGGDAPPARVGETPARHDDALLDKNKELSEREDRDINDWIARQGVPMIRSGTGVRYKLVRDVPGDTAHSGQIAVIRFRVELLNGTVCYASEPGTAESFRIEHDNVESGLHEAVQHMSPGDSAVIVIPSHRAFGLAGDQDKIPMRSPVVYRLGLVTLRNG